MARRKGGKRRPVWLSGLQYEDLTEYCRASGRTLDDTIDEAVQEFIDTAIETYWDTQFRRSAGA
jgi:hypothetical protein